MADRKWSELGAPVTPTDTDTVAMQRGTTNPRWSFATLRTYLDSFLAAAYVPLTRLISTGDGLQGGGDLAQDRTLSVDTTVARTNAAEVFDSTVQANGEFFNAAGQEVYSPSNLPPDAVGYDTIEDQGIPVAQESTINFTGAGVTATAGTGETVVDIPNAGTYNEVQKGGAQVSLGRQRMNFIDGANITISLQDQAGSDATDVTITASGGGGTGIQPAAPYLQRYLPVIEDATPGSETITADYVGSDTAVWLENSLRVQHDIWFNSDVEDDGSSRARIGWGQDGSKFGGVFGWFVDGGQQFRRDAGSVALWGSQVELEASTIQAAAALQTTSEIGADVIIDDTGQLLVSPLSATWGPETDTSVGVYGLISNGDEVGTGTGAWTEMTDLGVTLVNSGDAIAQISIYCFNNNTINSGEVEFALNAPTAGQAVTGPSKVMAINQGFDRLLTFRIDLGAVTAGQTWNVYFRRFSRSDGANDYDINFNGSFGPHKIAIFEPAGGGAGGGEVNTSSTPATVGANEADINMTKSGADLPKRKLVGGTSIQLTQGADAITVATDAVPDVATVDGDLLSFDGTNYSKIGVGTNGQTLTARPAAGVGLKVAWETPAGGGDMVAPGTIAAGNLYEAGATPQDAEDSGIASSTVLLTNTAQTVAIANLLQRTWSNTAGTSVLHQYLPDNGTIDQRSFLVNVGLGSMSLLSCADDATASATVFQVDHDQLTAGAAIRHAVKTVYSAGATGAFLAKSATFSVDLDEAPALHFTASLTVNAAPADGREGSIMFHCDTAVSITAGAGVLNNLADDPGSGVRVGFIWVENNITHLYIGASAVA